jgi:hypothetical protein
VTGIAGQMVVALVVATATARRTALSEALERPYLAAQRSLQSQAG